MRLSKKVKKEMAFFINPKSGKRQYNMHCQRCIHECKQSYHVKLVNCPKFTEDENIEKSR